MTVALIVAVSENGVIGKGNRLPWQMPADLKFFRKNTLGKTVIMGRKTAESIGKPLQQRRNIVISRNVDFTMEGFEVESSLEAAIQQCRREPEVFLIGGSSLYTEAMEKGLADRLFITLIHHAFEGDAFFQIPDSKLWRETMRQEHPADDKNPWPYTFLIWEKV